MNGMLTTSGRPTGIYNHINYMLEEHVMTSLIKLHGATRGERPQQAIKRDSSSARV